MSEYWKSTPKYWCKHCKIFVRDTKLEKTNHDATAKHQGNIKRFLRDLHRGHEREERDKDRAKSEVERLNGVVAEATSGPKLTPLQRSNAAGSGSSGREATPAERKSQLARLAEMGVAVPEEYRREVAMAGDWQTLSERPMWVHVKKEDHLDDFKDFKPDPTLNVGIRKRKIDGQEEDEEPGVRTVRKGWGSAIRRYPGSTGDNTDDLDALLNTKPPSLQDERVRREKSQELDRDNLHDSKDTPAEAEPMHPSVKKEDSEHYDIGSLPDQAEPSIPVIKQEAEDANPTIPAMKEAIVQPDLEVNIVDSPIPVSKDDEVVIKVVVSGSNPKDWKRPVWSSKAHNSGDDIAGVVHQVGRNVYEFKPGDRVAGTLHPLSLPLCSFTNPDILDERTYNSSAFHEMLAPGGSFAEYAVSWAHTTFHIPHKTSFEGACFHCPFCNQQAPIFLKAASSVLPTLE
ncbi:MAG: hypothetical protein Q9216_002041 [Gyalolechia sp. 2 TL-2023]